MSGINSTGSPSYEPTESTIQPTLQLTVSTFPPTESTTTTTPSVQLTISTLSPTVLTFPPSFQQTVSTFEPTTASSTNIPNTNPTLLPITSPTLFPSNIPIGTPSFSPSPQATSTPSLPRPTYQPTTSIQPSTSFTPPYSFTPSFQPTSSTVTQSNKITGMNNTLGIIIGVIGGAVLCIALILAMTWYRRRNKELDDAILAAERNRDSDRENNSNDDQEEYSARFNTVVDSSRKYSGRQLLEKPRESGQSSIPISSNGIISNHSQNQSHGNRSSQSARSSMMSNSKIPCFEWNDISVDFTQEMIIGEGSFGRVILARLLTKTEDGSFVTKDDVVVKVIKTPTKLKKSSSMNADYENEFRNAIKEVKVHMDAESKIYTKDCIAKVYGIVEGELPRDLSMAFNSLLAVGIVMRYEAGGSLAYLIHASAESEKEKNDEESKNNITNSYIGGRRRSVTRDNRIKLNLADEIRVLSRVALGLAELHKAGIVHGDIKPDNVLLSSCDLATAEVRLADFGLAELREHAVGANIGYSSAIVETINDRGTPIYCAPEMLYDPFKLNMKGGGEVTYAKPSEKTDMYAFSVLSWEVLTQQKPFSNIKVAAELSVKVHQGVRPNINELPTGCPNIIRNLIESGWDQNRYKRRSAADCAIILRQCHEQIISAVYDVYLTYRRDKSEKLQNCMDFVHRRLVERGLRVCFLNDRSLSITSMNRNNSSSSMHSSVNNSMSDRGRRLSSRENKDEFELNLEKKLQKIKSIAKAKVILICIDETFQRDSECLYELQSNRDLKTPRQVIPLFLEPTHAKFPDDEIKVHCQLSSAATQTFTIATVASDDGWSSDEGPNESLLTTLYTEIDRLSDYIHKRINE